MAFLGIFWYQLKTFIWKKYSNSKQTKYPGFVKLGVQWDWLDSDLIANLFLLVDHFEILSKYTAGLLIQYLNLIFKS